MKTKTPFFAQGYLVSISNAPNWDGHGQLGHGGGRILDRIERCDKVSAVNSIDVGLLNLRAPYSKVLFLLVVMAIGIELAVRFNLTSAIAGLIGFSFLHVSLGLPSGLRRVLKSDNSRHLVVPADDRVVTSSLAPIFTRLWTQVKYVLARTNSGHANATPVPVIGRPTAEIMTTGVLSND